MDRIGGLAKAVAQTGALQLGFFTNNLGQSAPLRFDLSRLWQDPRMLATVAKGLCDVAKEEIGGEYDRLGAADHSGLPLATLSSQILDRPLVVLRRMPYQDAYGPILGTMFPGDKVLVIDDVIATGKKALEMASIVRNEGGVLYGYCVLLDKQEGGSDLLRKRGIRFACVATLMEVSSELHKLGWLEDATFDSIAEYAASFGH
jgi:uridine monophosphate synthetase